MEGDAALRSSGEGALRADLEERIRRIILREFPGGLAAGSTLAADTPILGKGLLDSVEALALITAIEAELGVAFDDDELSMDLFASLRALADRVGQKLGEDGAREPATRAHATLPDLLDAVAREHAGSLAIVEPQRQLTYGRLRAEVAVLADHLAGLGVNGGDIVALLLPNGAEFVIAFLAAVRRGGVVLPLNSRYQETELGYHLAEAAPALLVTHPPLAELCRRVAARASRPPRVLVLDEEGRRAPTAPGPPSPRADRRPPAVRPDDPVLCQFSSGSTAAPKRVVRTHANLLFELSRLGPALGLGASDRLLGVVPFSHVNGLVRTMLGALSVGATLVPLREFKRQEVAATIERERITVVIAVPFVFGILADTTFRPPADFSSLRLCVSASAPLPAATSRRFHERYGLFVRQLYGSTETGTIAFHGAPDVEDSLDSVGVPLEGVEVRILRDDGSVADVDESGDVAVKSPAAITGYPGAGPAGGPFRDGYLVTGDVGRIDRRGRLYLVGRKSWFINRSGYKVNPWELETLLQGHPKVEDVAVIGVPTRFGDELVKAVIAPRGTCSAEEIIAYCRGKVADFKIPSAVEFRPRLPRNASGKILRRELG